jgi:hypothetical protein
VIGPTPCLLNCPVVKHVSVIAEVAVEVAKAGPASTAQPCFNCSVSRWVSGSAEVAETPGGVVPGGIDRRVVR